MPIKAVDYSNTVIYKLVCNDLNIKDIYVGHTTKFRKRKYSHKTSCCNEKDTHYKLKVYQTIRENGGWENWSMIEIEKFPCKDGNEARARERHWYEELKATLNMEVPNRSMGEWYIDNRKDVLERVTIYASSHKEEKKIYDKQYRILNFEKKRKMESRAISCSCGKTYTHQHKLRHFKTKFHLENCSK